MSKLLKIGVPILVAVLVLIIGTGLVLAQRDAPVSIGPSASYDADDSWCPQQCQGPQGCICPQPGNCVSNCPGYNSGYSSGCGNGANCPQAGYCRGNCGGSGGVGAGAGFDYQPRCGGCRK